MDKKKISNMVDFVSEQNYFDFKEVFDSVFVEMLDSKSMEIEKEVNKELARFAVVDEGISIPLPNNPNVKDAHLFAIESDDEDNIVVKFKVNGESKCMKLESDDEDNKEFYKQLSEMSMDDFDEEVKKQIALDMNEMMDKEFAKDVPMKKEKNIERGTQIKQQEVKMETDMSKLSGKERLEALKKMGEKAKAKKSKEAMKAMKEELDPEKPMYRIVGKHPDGKPFKSPKANEQSLLKIK